MSASEDHTERLRVALEYLQRQYTLREQLISKSRFFIEDNLYSNHSKDEILGQGDSLLDCMNEAELHYREFFLKMMDIKGICSKDEESARKPQCKRLLDWSNRTRKIIREYEKSRLNIKTIPRNTFYGNIIYYGHYMRAYLQPKGNK